MRCVALEVRLSLESDMSIPTYLEALRQSIARAGSEVDGPTTAAALAAPVRLRIRDKRLGVVASARSWSVRSERPAEAEVMLWDVLEQFTLAEDFLKEVPVQTAVVTTHWMEPLDANWEDLLHDYIQAFYRPGTLPPEASDTSVSFVAVRDDGPDQFQSGPMQKGQLLSAYLRFWTADEPQVPDMLFFFRHIASSAGSGPMDAARLGRIARAALGRAASFAERHYAQFARHTGGEP